MRRSVTARSEATRQFKHSEVMDRRASLAMTEKMFAMTEKMFAMTEKMFAMTGMFVRNDEDGSWRGPR